MPENGFARMIWCAVWKRRRPKFGPHRSVDLDPTAGQHPTKYHVQHHSIPAPHQIFRPTLGTRNFVRGSWPRFGPLGTCNLAMFRFAWTLWTGESPPKRWRVPKNKSCFMFLNTIEDREIRWCNIVTILPPTLGQYCPHLDSNVVTQSLVLPQAAPQPPRPISGRHAAQA